MSKLTLNQNLLVLGSLFLPQFFTGSAEPALLYPKIPGFDERFDEVKDSSLEQAPLVCLVDPEADAAAWFRREVFGLAVGEMNDNRFTVAG